jgi:hypothetical protein
MNEYIDVRLTVRYIQLFSDVLKKIDSYIYIPHALVMNSITPCIYVLLRGL